MNNPQLLQELESAARGLLLMSETDAPLVPFLWEGASLTPADVLRCGKYAANTPIETRDLLPFFAAMTEDQTGDLPEQREMRASFRRLQTRLPELLTDIQVFRVGTVEIHSYIAGRTPSGDVAGLEVVQVET